MLNRIKERIEEGNRFLITAHIDLDGDAVGSVFCFYWLLKNYKKDVFVYLKDEVPYKYKFLPGPDDERLFFKELPDEKYDTVFVLDCGDLHRIGNKYEVIKQNGFIVNIDHHNTNSGFGNINLVIPEASSTAEIIYDVICFLKAEITHEMAINIYTGIVTDTGSFRYENTNPKALMICARMIEIGVKPAYVAQKVYESHPKERFFILGKVLNTLESHKNGKIIMAHITRDMAQGNYSLEEFTDGFVEFIKEMDGIEIAVLIRQVEDNRYKISMRSKGNGDVSEICSLFGGGGHKKAAGCYIDGDLKEVKRKLLEVIN
ncbi:MAG TPA: bifunctional oligoribonuclease/PAP phosphatase NrnA [Syntrophorhabdaceae bacterium]|nr:bifunctional oligoribonuclease/PAP phosphatase NrnA [Syntrophorhabdaceae bacterium]